MKIRSCGATRSSRWPASASAHVARARRHPRRPRRCTSSTVAARSSARAPSRGCSPITPRSARTARCWSTGCRGQRGGRRRRPRRGGPGRAARARHRARAIRHPPAARRHRRRDRRVRPRRAPAAAEHRHRRGRRARPSATGKGRWSQPETPPSRWPTPRALHRHDLGPRHARPGRRRPAPASAPSSGARSRSTRGPPATGTCSSETPSARGTNRSISRSRPPGASLPKGSGPLVSSGIAGSGLYSVALIKFPIPAAFLTPRPDTS